MLKRFASVMLAAFLLVSLIPGALAADIDNHWAKAEILILSQKGIMQGDGSGNYRPDSKITRAEFAALLNRTFGYTKEGDIRFSDVTYKSDWKSQAVTRAATLGYMLGSDNKANPDGVISRQEASAMLVRILRLPLETGSTSFKDEASIASWAKDYIKTAEKYGIVTAMPSGKFEPAASLSRAQAATIISRAMGELYNKPGSFTGGVLSGNVTINTTGVTLENTTIGGNLYLTEGIGSGSVTLKNVKVLGKTIVAGGGTTSGVTAEDTAFTGDLSLIYPAEYLSGIRFALKGSSSTKDVHVKVPAVLDTTGLSADATGFSDLSLDVVNTEIGLNGNFGSIVLNNPTTTLLVDSGTVSSLTLSAGQFSGVYQVTVGASGIIGELSIDAPSSILGTGTLSNVRVNTSNVTIGQDVSVNINNITLVNGVSVKIGNNTLMPFGESAELSDLKLKSADGSEDIALDAFSSRKISYHAYSDADTVRVYPYAGDGNDIKIKINGEEVASGSFVSVDTSDENTTFQIQVSCEGKNTTIYTVTMADLVAPELASLSIYNSDNKIAVIQTPLFDPSVTNYTVTTSGTNMMITAVAASTGSSVKIGNSAEQTGTSTANAIVAASQRTVDIIVSNGFQSKTYTVKLVKQQTTGAVYRSSTTEGSGTNAEWKITVSNPSEGDVFSIEDKSFIIGESDSDCEQISRTYALAEIAETYAANNTFLVTAKDNTLTFANKTSGSISSTASVTSNVGTVAKSDGRNRRNGTSTITVKALPSAGSNPVELTVNDKTYRLCSLASDVETNHDILLSGVTTTAQIATLLEKKLSGSTTGGFLTSLSGSSIIVSAGETAAPTVTFDSTLFSVTKTEGNPAEAEAFHITFPEIAEGMVISITVNGRTSDFQAHDRIMVSEGTPAADIAKAFYSSSFKVSASSDMVVLFQSRLIGSSGNSQEIETSGSIVSDPEQSIVGKDTKMGSAVITVSKVPKYGDTLTIDSTIYTFSDTSGSSEINIAGLSTTLEIASAIKKAIGTAAKVSGDRVTVASQTAEPPSVTFTAS